MISTKKLLFVFDVLVIFALMSSLLIMLGIKTNPLDHNETTGIAVAGFVFAFCDFVHKQHDKDETTTAS